MMSLMIRVTSIAFRGLRIHPQCQQLLSCNSKQNNVVLFGSKFTRTFFKERLSRQTTTAALSENNTNPQDWTISALPMRYVFINTCQNRWEDIPDGFLFDAGYADSHPDSSYNPNMPVVLAVHDMYGGHEDLIPLLAPLVLKNYRVIGLNLPSSDHTNGVGFAHDDAYLHSTDEYAEFIGDFMEELKIPKADLMLGVGTGCYPLLRICAKTELCKSTALICPGGHIHYKGIQPHWLYQLLAEMWETPFLRPFVKTFASFFKHLKGLRKYSTHEIIMSFQVTRGIDFDNIGNYLFNIKLKNLPVGVVYCKKDKMVEDKISEHYCQLIGLEEDDQMTFYDKEMQITKQAATNSPKQGIVLEERPSNVCVDYRLPIIKMIEKLINSVHQRR